MRVSEFNKNIAQSVINMLNGNRASYGGISSIKFGIFAPLRLMPFN